MLLVRQQSGWVSKKPCMAMCFRVTSRCENHNCVQVETIKYLGSLAGCGVPEVVR